MNTEKRRPIPVDIMEWKQAKSPAILETTGLGPCVAIGIYIPEARAGLLGHFPDPELNLPDINKMFARVKRFLPLTPEWRAYLGGGGYAYRQSFEDFNRNRLIAFNKLKEIGFEDSQIIITWNGDSNETGVLSLDTRSGQVLYERFYHNEF